MQTPKITIRPVSLKHNMRVNILMENEKEETGYFKKFCYKNGT